MNEWTEYLRISAETFHEHTEEIIKDNAQVS